MKRRIMLATAATLALGAGIAKGHDTEFQSSMVIQDGGYFKGYGTAYGFVESKQNPKCVGNREVQLRSTNGTSKDVLDEGTTSKNGGFYVFGPPPKDAIALDVKLTKENIGKNGHKHICTGDLEFLDTVP